MTYEYNSDAELDASTNRVMVWGASLLILMAAVFPLYRWIEPSNRDSARETQLSSLAQQGEKVYSDTCSSCHGLSGEGVSGPALNSKQFLQAATNEQIELLTAVGVPGTQMTAYSQDFAGPLTSEQIRSIAIYLRTLEETAPDRPDWRAMVDG